MPWKRTEPMNERIKFIAEYLEGEETLTDLCLSYGVSRKTAYKWIERYNEHGPQALIDRSRAPLSHPHAVEDDIVELIIEERKRHPNWGPKKLRVILERKYPKLRLPVASTIGQILKRNGLIGKKRRRRTSTLYTGKLESYLQPNSIWCADFKGHFPIAGKRCHPLTISDGYSRFLIKCQALPRPLHEPSQKIFESAFKEYGLPKIIRTDNGAPFSTLAPGGLSRLAIWWIKLGIKPERILPGRPDQNGRHERMHRTLKLETVRPPKTSFRAQQKSFDDFRHEYNYERPHESLNQKVPTDFYKPSSREFPKRLPEVEYPDHFQVAKAYPNGVISFNNTQWYISACLKDEWVGLEEIGSDRWKVYFSHVELGIIDIRNWTDRGCRQFGSMVRIDGEINGKLAKKNRKPIQ